MHIILLSGGSGKRLWPLSNDVRSKQFLKLFDKNRGNAAPSSSPVYESMLQRVYRQITTVSPASTVTVATGKNQVSAIRNQLGSQVGVCVEPMRRDTFPAIALAAAYLKSEQGLALEDVVIVCPVDPYVELDYFQALERLENAALREGANLTLMGVKPTYPSEKYGYILPEQTGKAVENVSAFKEKPDQATARQYIRQGALWNCGVFAFRLGYLLKILAAYLPCETYQELYSRYGELPKISFDYAVVEKEPSIKCIQFAGQWKDVGAWNTLAEEMDAPTIGNVVLDEACEDVQVINELDAPLLVMGAKHMVVAASVDGILVSDKDRSAQLKGYVDQLDQRAMYEEKSWGTFTVLHVSEKSITVRLDMLAGRGMSYHQHQDRDEVWTVLSGEGEITLDGQTRTVRPGDVVRLPAGMQHSLRAHTAMQVIEIQIGA